MLPAQGETPLQDKERDDEADEERVSNGIKERRQFHPSEQQG
jgi:hypothetical protein